MPYIPDTMATLPWPRIFDPLEDEAAAESIAWHWRCQPPYFNTHRDWDCRGVFIRTGSGAEQFDPSDVSYLLVRKVVSVPWCAPPTQEVRDKIRHKPRLTLLSYLLDRLRLGIDFVYTLFTTDGHADAEAAPVVRRNVDALLDVLHSPYEPPPQAAGVIMLCQAFQGFVI